MDPLAVIDAADAGRRSELLALKHVLMQGDVFAFFRGTAALFAEDWNANSTPALQGAPVTWLCGDAHLENFGTYRAHRGTVVFELNDFDEAALGSSLYDLVRLATSTFIWYLNSPSRGDALATATTLVESYAAALRRGKAFWIDRETARGEVGRLMEQVYTRSGSYLLEKRTELAGKKRRIILGKRALPIDDEQRRRASAAIAAFAETTNDPPSRYEILDVAWRVAGTGSLGLERYVVLLAGDGSPSGGRLMDVKLATPSTAESAHAQLPHIVQPSWSSEAERVVGAYQRLQCRSPNRLGAVTIDGRSFVVRTLQPVEDRLDWSKPGLDVAALHAELGSLLAWAHLRSGGRDGSATADTLMAFGEDLSWHAPVIEYARNAAERFRGYWMAFRDSERSMTA